MKDVMDNEKIILSILIPVYNAEMTIDRCLKSILTKDIMNYEVIIIDDGSNDASFEIIKSFVAAYRNIRAYSQNNSGVSDTRQKLISYAVGKYIMFCDADDYFEPDAVSGTIEILKKASTYFEVPDVFVFGYKLVRSFGNKSINRRNLPEGMYSKKVIGKYHVKNISDLYWSALWNKCYRRDICFSPEIKFEEQMEDVMFNVDFMSRIKHVYISERCIYNYVQIGESMTRTKKQDNEEAIINAEKTYYILMRKLLKTYPEENIYVLESIYILCKGLEKRLSYLGGNINLLLLNKKIRKQLGWRVYILNVKVKFLDIFRYIKNIIKDVLSRL